MNGDAAADANPLKRAMKRLMIDHGDLDDAQLADAAATSGATAMGSCGERSIVTVCGRVRSLTLRPRAGSPSLEAELYDGSGTVTVVWLGRQSVGGITPGRQIKASGRICVVDNRRTLFNPRYELLGEGR